MEKKEILVKPKVARLSKEESEKDLIQSRIVLANKMGRPLEKVKKGYLDLFGEQTDKNKEERSFLKFYAKHPNSIYKIPRKDKKSGGVIYITGLSINVVKDIASIYGHLSYGIKNVHYNGIISASAQAYCLDLVNNTSNTREFEVTFPKYVRETSAFTEESYKYLYSIGMKRVRSCIEKIVPYWLTESVFRNILGYKEKSPKEQIIKNIWSLAKQVDSRIKTEQDICVLTDSPFSEKGLQGKTSKELANIEVILAGMKERGQDKEETDNPGIIDDNQAKKEFKEDFE